MKRIIVGVTGASGAIMSKYLLHALRDSCNYEIHLIFTNAACLSWNLETGLPLDEVMNLAHAVHREEDISASIASGSYLTEGMIIMPCSMKSLAGIVSGYADNLLLRAADVCLKESRKLVLVPREMPLGKIHLRNMSQAADLGCTLVPPMLTFYNAPNSMADQINHVLGKVLMQFGINYSHFKPWGEDSEIK